MVQLTKSNTNSMGTEISQEQKNVPGVIPDKWLNIAVKETFSFGQSLSSNYIYIEYRTERLP